MTLKLYYHPLSSFCQKVVIAFYETGTAFEPVQVDFGNPESAAAFKKLWPIGKFPVITDNGRTIPESSIIIEYLAQRAPARSELIPRDPDQALACRTWDRFFDLNVEVNFQKIVGDRLRPADKKDPFGVEQARAQLQVAYGVIEQQVIGKTWAIGESFTMADCSAAPALFFANMLEPWGGKYPEMAAYYARLKSRPSYARTFKESEPYLGMVPR